MKIGSFCMAAAVLGAMALTQGCVTTESEGSGRGAGAKHRGVYKAPHKSKAVAEEGSFAATEPYDAYVDDGSMLMTEEPITSTDSTYMGGPNAGAGSYGETEIYIVRKGDILSKLAVEFDTTTATLVEMNGLSNPDVLYVGQELRVPAGRGGSKTTSKPTGAIKAGGTYTIQKGDTLSEIALAAGVTIDDLRSLNGIKGDVIMAGQDLKIPSYGKVPTGRKKSSTPAKKSTPAPEPVEPAPVVAEPMVAEPVVAPMAAAPITPVEVDMVVDEVMYPGETLDDKARQYGVSKAEIMRLNGITDESQVREGQTIRIPVAE
ncbi:LysM peptidoglycan-binding domain-containing protein [Pontiella sp.]|uniref:muramidase family protein n=1 Tax=Pontiella sp. TaxID=2837462 RepID=UPI003561704F